MQVADVLNVVHSFEIWHVYG